VPERLALRHGAAVCKFFYRPALLNIFYKDVHLPVEALKDLGEAREPGALAGALAAILGYLDENPFFFTYRFGRAEGQAMGAGIRELHALMAWAAEAGTSVQVRAVRRYYLPGGGDEIVETDPGETYAW
jgi:hypothetical protein